MRTPLRLALVGAAAGTEQNRLCGLGPLIGTLSGPGTGALLGLGRAVGTSPTPP